MSTTKEERNRRRKEVVEAIVVRQEPVHLVRRVFNIPERRRFLTGSPSIAPEAGMLSKKAQEVVAPKAQWL